MHPELLAHNRCSVNVNVSLSLFKRWVKGEDDGLGKWPSFTWGTEILSPAGCGSCVSVLDRKLSGSLSVKGVSHGLAVSLTVVPGGYGNP